MAEDKVRVRFDDPEHGWIGLSIKAEEAGEFQQSFSYTPHDSFLDLISAISLLSQGDDAATVLWNTGPTDFEFKFQRSGEEVHLTIQKHPDHLRAKGQGELLLRVIGTFESVALPFWRGLQDLRSRFPSQELDRRWHRAFPAVELERLTKRLKG